MNSEAGFSMTELLAALLIGSTIAGFCYSAYIYSQKMFLTWDRKSHVVRLTDGTLQTLAADMRKAKSVVLVSDSILSMQQICGKKITYRIGRDPVMRNDVTFNCDSSIALTTSIIAASTGYTIGVASFSKFQTCSTCVEVQQLQSSASQFQDPLFDGSAD